MATSREEQKQLMSSKSKSLTVDNLIMLKNFVDDLLYGMSVSNVLAAEVDSCGFVTVPEITSEQRSSFVTSSHFDQSAILADEIATASNNTASVLSDLNITQNVLPFMSIFNNSSNQHQQEQPQDDRDENETYPKRLFGMISQADSHLYPVLEDLQTNSGEKFELVPSQVKAQIRSSSSSNNHNQHLADQPSKATESFSENVIEYQTAANQHQPLPTWTNENLLFFKAANRNRSQSVPEVNNNRRPVHRLSAPAVMALPVQLQHLLEEKAQFLHRHQQQYNEAKVQWMTTKAQLRQEMDAFVEKQEIKRRNFILQATASELDDEWDRLRTMVDFNNDNAESNS